MCYCPAERTGSTDTSFHMVIWKLVLGDRDYAGAGPPDPEWGQWECHPPSSLLHMQHRSTSACFWDHGALEPPVPWQASQLRHGWTCAGGMASSSALVKPWVTESGFLAGPGWVVSGTGREHPTDTRLLKSLFFPWDPCSSAWLCLEGFVPAVFQLILTAG